MIKKDIYKILIAGEGGQGIQSIAHILARAAYECDLNVSYMPNYGVEQRGGVSLGFIQLGKGPIGFPKFAKADLLVVMCDRAIERTEQYVSKETLYLYDADLISSIKLAGIRAEKLPIPATSTASKKLDPKVFNIILLGAIVNEIGIIKNKIVQEALIENFTDKYALKPQLKNLNIKALEMGQKLAQEVYKNDK